MTSAIEFKERNQLLYQTLDELKTDYRIVLYHFYLEGKSYQEICRELNITESILTQRLARARKKLLQLFSKKWTNDLE
ncbi:RNA polymerase sigma factor [Cohnella sp. GCM10020058]|uniref:RNA polymerase sigma factor n=1 Tax=Cohnella sp. GCM10020058 TaxID=3317330 RepID=UPI003642B611